MLFILFIYSLKLDVVFILENKMFVMSSKLYLIKKNFSLFYFTYVENLPHGTSSDFAFLNWDERCLGNCSIDTSRYIVFMHSSNSCYPKCTNTIQTFSTFLGVHDGEIELWTNGWKRGGGGLLFSKWKMKVPVMARTTDLVQSSARTLFILIHHIIKFYQAPYDSQYIYFLLHFNTDHRIVGMYGHGHVMWP